MYKQHVYLPSTLNLAARAVVNGAWSVSNGFGTSGFQQMTVEVFHDYVAGSDVQMYIETRPDNETSAWHRVQSISVASGTATSSDLVYSKTTGADDYCTWNIPINYDHVRLGFTSTSGSTDAVTVTVRLGVTV